MKKRVLSILLCVIMLCSLLPTAALAVEGEPDVKYINVTGGTEQEPTFGFGDPGENTMAVYISGSGDYEVADNFSGIATIINDTAVTIEGGAVNTEDVYIFGEGSLTVGDVTFTSGHEIELSDDTVDAIFGAVMTEGSDVVDISGTITAGTELVVWNAIISGALEFAAGFEEVESGHLTIGGGGSLTVEESATVIAAQDARITALSGVTIKGIALYDADTSTKLSDENDSYTVEAEVENFIWLENGENSEPIQKWVLLVDGGEGDPNAPQNNEYWFEYDWRDDATVMLGEESVPSRWSESYTDPINFTTGDSISFTLTPPSDGGTYNSPVVEVEVFDWAEEKPYNTVEPLTATDGVYTFTPEKDNGFVVRVWWTTEEYNYDTFGPGEGEIVVEVMINGSESATVTSDTLNGVDESKKLSVGTKTKYILDESTTRIELLITPGENEEIREIFVGWEPQEFTPDENGSVCYTWTLSDENSHYFEAVFGGTGGGNDSPEIPPYVPPVTPPIDTPTNDKVDIPISGDDETIHVGATVSGDTVTVDEIDIGQLDGVIGSDVDTGTVTIDFSGLDSAVPITTIELPANVVKEIAEAVNDPENDAESLEIVMPSGVSITFDADALSEKVSQADGADITISIESHEDAELTDAQKDAVGSRPAFDINITSGGEHISDIGGKITIGAPYELKNNEKENGLVVWYVDNKGNRERCQGSYDPVNKRMNWETNHLSLYMIDYCPSATFADLDIDAWYIDSTDFVIANGLMNGIGDDKFDPNGTTTRAMIVTILWRLEGSPIVNYAMDFEDVDAEQWYTEAVRWAASEKIVEGYGNGKFGTNDAITREQMVTIMYRYAQYKGYDVSVGENTNILSYGDVFDVAEWAIPAMQWACGSGMIQGIADGSTMNLAPQGNATRAQAAAILQRFVENVANEK